MIKNKKGFIENWLGFIVLAAIGIAVYLLQLTIWGRMDFEISALTKIIVFIGILIAAGVFTKLLLE